MIKIKVNGLEREASNDSTVLNVLRMEEIEVPTMCYLDKSKNFPTCMVCMVKDYQSGKMIPSCSTLVSSGMDISTEDEEVTESRKIGLELLLSDHVGDCNAPCQTGCPAFMDIPLMNRLLIKGKIDEALKIVKDSLAIPTVLCRICPAPCENACRRRSIEDPISIRALERHAADFNANQQNSYLPEKAEPNGRKVAIIGTGPAGLSCAFFLLQKGYQCTLFDKNAEPGGALRYAIPDNELPKDILDQEVDSIKQLGAAFRMNCELPENGLEKLLKEFDVVVLATGGDGANFIGLEKKGSIFNVDKTTFQTNIEGVFAIGNAIKPGRVAVRAVAHGKEVALTIDQYLNGEEMTGEVRMFNSRFGKLKEEEHADYLLEGDDGPRVETVENEGFSKDQAEKEAERCMHCDCREKDNCKLRIYSDEYEAVQKRYYPKERALVRKDFKNEPIVYEPEKCIKCGICVKITSIHEEDFGLTYIGKGFDVEVGVPFDDPEFNALEKTAALCAKNCPTGALALFENGKS